MSAMMPAAPAAAAAKTRPKRSGKGIADTIHATTIKMMKRRV